MQVSISSPNWDKFNWSVFLCCDLYERFFLNVSTKCEWCLADKPSMVWNVDYVRFVLMKFKGRWWNLSSKRWRRQSRNITKASPTGRRQFRSSRRIFASRVICDLIKSCLTFVFPELWEGRCGWNTFSEWDSEDEDCHRYEESDSWGLQEQVCESEDKLWENISDCLQVPKSVE